MVVFVDLSAGCTGMYRYRTFKVYTVESVHPCVHVMACVWRSEAGRHGELCKVVCPGTGEEVFPGPFHYSRIGKLVHNYVWEFGRSWPPVLALVLAV